MSKKGPTDEDVKTYFVKVTAWVTLFASLSEKLEGYGKAEVTPYIHSMAYHVPRFMKKHEGIKKFTGQGVEKNNDDCRRIHLQKSNKWDAAKDVLLVQKRLETLSDLERTPRQYRKQNDGYWSSPIRESRAKRPRLSQEKPAEDPAQENIEDLTPPQLREKLKGFGITTRVRSLQRLQEMYQAALQSASE